MQSTTPESSLSPFQGSVSFSPLTPGGAPLARGYYLAAAAAAEESGPGAWNAAAILPRTLDCCCSLAPEGQ